MGKKQKMYRVVWKIDLYACSKRQAAKKALEIQRDRGSLATVFEVKEWDVWDAAMAKCNAGTIIDAR